MKVSWRNIDDDSVPGVFEHHHIFTPGQKHEGKAPREFLVHLIQETPAIEVALNGRSIWSSSSTSFNIDDLVVRALIGEPRNAQILITIDYTVQDDWIDNECRTCGYLYDTHAHGCTSWAAIDKGWLELVEQASKKQYF